MGKIQFSLANLQKGESVRSFVQTIFRHAKAAGIESDFLQLTIAYNALELSIQANVPVPTELTAKGKWLKEVDSKSTLFENIVEEVNASGRRFGKGKQFQYTNRGSPRFGSCQFQNSQYSQNQFPQSIYQNNFQ
jgi:hypothetical protein